MRVWVVWHMEAGFETTIVKVYDALDKAAAYIAEYEKDNPCKREYEMQFADTQFFEVE